MRRKEELQSLIEEQEKKLKELNSELDAVKKEEQIKRELKKNYKLNDVPDRIEYNYEQLYNALKHEVLNHCDELIDKDFIDNIENRYSINYGKDPKLLYNCPECGASGSLYIGDYGDFSKDRLSVTCSQCSFRVPHYISDYGEAWCEFKEWLVENKYL